MKDGKFYIGQTEDLEKRLIRHNNGSEKYTSKLLPWNLVWYAEHNNRKKAFGLEKKLKGMKSRARLITYIAEHPVPGSENLQISNLIDFREST